MLICIVLGLEHPWIPIDAARAKQLGLAERERGPVDRILRAIDRTPEYPLLKRAIERFVFARERNAEEILSAAADVELLGEEKVLFNPSIHYEKYLVANCRFLEQEEQRDEGVNTIRIVSLQLVNIVLGSSF